MATARIDLTLTIGTLFFLIPYNVLMYGINDVFDYASDLANPRKGGIEGALLPRRLHVLGKRMDFPFRAAKPGKAVCDACVFHSSSPFVT